jgi:hypothetical protein
MSIWVVTSEAALLCEAATSPLAEVAVICVAELTAVTVKTIFPVKSSIPTPPLEVNVSPTSKKFGSKDSWSIVKTEVPDVETLVDFTVTTPSLVSVVDEDKART